MPSAEAGRQRPDTASAPDGTEVARARRRSRLSWAAALAWVVVVVAFWLGRFVPAMRADPVHRSTDLYGYFFPKFVWASSEGTTIRTRRRPSTSSGRARVA
jgi:hypothetical protein